MPLPFSPKSDPYTHDCAGVDSGENPLEHCSARNYQENDSFSYA